MTGTTLQRPNERGIYFFAILPPKNISDEIREIQLYVEKKYHTHEALRRPVHITVIPPFETPPIHERKLVEFTHRFCERISPFEVKLDSYGEFRRNVLHIRIERSNEIVDLQRSLSHDLSRAVTRGSSSGTAFTPHITVGYKDITRPMFDEAWREFGEQIFRRSFILDTIHFMRWNYGGWNTVTQGMFGSKQKEAELSLFG